MASLIKLSIAAEDDDLEILLGLLAMNVPHGWEEQSQSTGETLCVVHSGHAGFCTELESTIKHLLPHVQITRQVIQEENWAEAWKEFFTPVVGGEHFIVLAPWMQKELAEATKIPILIEPKMAFGTGHHATTSLCLDAISTLYSQGKISSNCRFLDLGTGSGILALACCKLGMSGHGVDIEAASVDNAMENRELNHIPAQQFSIALGGVEVADKDYDLVLANILAAPLRELSSNIVATMKNPTGRDGHPLSHLVLSGMLDIQADSVEKIYTDLGLPVPTRLQRGEWVALVF